MSQLSLDAFDKTLQKSNEWVHDLMGELGWDDAPRTLGVFRTVVHALRDHLPLPAPAALAGEVLLVLRGLYLEDVRPVGDVPVLRHRGEMLGRLAERLGGSYGLHGEEAITGVMHAVMRVLDRHVSRGEIENAHSTLPAELRVLWPTAAAR